MAEVEVWEQVLNAASPSWQASRPRRSIRRRLEDKWKSIQVESQDAYSIERLESLNLYCTTTSTSRVILLCVLTPVPALLAALVLQSFPLRPPTEGLVANWVFWLRLFITHSMIGVVENSSMTRLIPGLVYPVWKRIAVALVTNVAFVATCLLAASQIGFPLPFMMQFGVVPIGIFSALATRLGLGPVLFAKDSPLKSQADRYNRFFGSFMVLCGVFPVYKVLYDLIPVTYRGVIVVLLPAWKFAAKHFMVRSTRDFEDVMPVLVTLAVDFLCTIFISVCMSSTQSISSMLLFVAVNIGQSLLEFRAMSANGKALRELLDE